MVREQRQQQEEKLALMELRRAVQQMQGVEQQRTSQEEAVSMPLQENPIFYLSYTPFVTHSPFFSSFSKLITSTGSGCSG